MASNPVFRRYLEHFGPTVPVRDLVERPGVANVVALRHDIDYDLDVALELAYWEHAAGCRASYYVLHGAPYWDDPLLIEKCLQLQDYGHEVGLHLNLLTEWHRGEIDDVEAELGRLLDRFRAAGVTITGVAAHGDKACYDEGFTNYWPFAELRPANPAASEARVTAEGTIARENDRAIVYPPDRHALVRGDGQAFPYWSIALARHGLDYEASRVPAEHYFSDSGGTWKRTPDPLSEPFDRGRRLVLMHPLYWRGSQRHYYFLSTARSGSKWLARFLDEATSLTARHEFSLNHRIVEGAPVADKHTGAGFTDLLAAPAQAKALIAEARNWSEGLLTDYAEANVYLERFLEVLPKGEGTMLVHLHREPQAVVRSLIERGWYNVPFDDRHPPVAINGWNEMSQLEQACWYVRDTSLRLAAATGKRLVFERMVKDLGYLTRFLLELGIPVHPRLAARVFGESVNATKVWSVAPLDDWPADQLATLRRVLDPAEEALGYRKVGRMKGAIGSATAAFARERKRRQQARNDTLELLDDITRARSAGCLSVKNCALTWEGGEAVARFSARSASYLLLGSGYWHGAKEMSQAYLAKLQASRGVLATPDEATGAPRPGWLHTVAGRARPVANQVQRWLGQVLATAEKPPRHAMAWGGWPASADQIYTVGVTLRFAQLQGSVRVICLSHDTDGKLISQRDIGILSPSWPTFRRHFRPDRNAASFNIALYTSKDEDACTVVIEELRLAAQSENRSGALTPDEVLARAEASSKRSPKPDAADRPLVAGIAELDPMVVALGSGRIKPWGVSVTVEAGGLRIAPDNGARASHFLAGGGSWHKALLAPTGSAGGGTACGWRASPGDRVRGYVHGQLHEHNPPVGVFVLIYDKEGALAGDVCVGRLSPTQATVSFDVPILHDACYFNVALHLPESSGAILIEDVRLGRFNCAA